MYVSRTLPLLFIICFLLTEQKELGEDNDCVATTLLTNMSNYDEKEAPFTQEDVKAVLATMHAGAPTYVR